MLYAGYLFRNVKLPAQGSYCQSYNVYRHKGYPSCNENSTSTHTGQYNFQYFSHADRGV